MLSNDALNEMMECLNPYRAERAGTPLRERVTVVARLNVVRCEQGLL